MAALCMQRESSSGGKQQLGVDAGKYVRYTPEQVEALERVYAECPKPSSLRRQQLIRDFVILSNIEPKQLKVWFQNRRCREKQKKESSRLQSVNRKLTAMNKLLMEENDRLQKQVSHLVCENGYMRQKIHTVAVPAADTSSDSAVMSGHQQQKIPTPQHPGRDANTPAGLLAIAEETLAEFLGKATGTAVDWVQMIGMKPGPDSIGIVAVSRNCRGVAARACGLVSLEPTKVAEILSDRLSWFRDCRCVDVASSIPTGNGGTLELVYMQVYAPTTLASARDFWTLRYTTSLEDGSLVICERSLTSSTGGPSGPPSTCFARAEMLPSGYLIRPCEGSGSIIHIVDHIDFDTSSVPDVLRPIYESSKILAQKMTMAALHHIRQISQEINGEIQPSSGRQPAVLRALSQRLCRGFNDAVNGFADDGWTTMRSDDIDVTIAISSSPCKYMGSQYNNFSILPTYGGVLCAKASMLLQNVPPALLVRFLREHRSEWADRGIDVYSAASLKASPYDVPCAKPGGYPSTQTILPLAQTVEHEEFLEVVRLEGHAFSPEEISLSRDMYLLQLCSGIDETTSASCAQLVFAPIDDSFGDDAPLVTSGFRIILLEAKSDGEKATQTLDLASALDVGRGGSPSNVENNHPNNQNLRSVLTIAFQFVFENHYRDSVAAMARQYVRSIVTSVQRVAMAISPSPLSSRMVSKSLNGAPEAATLASWICRSYRVHSGGDLLQDESPANGDVLKQLWGHPDAITCCSVKMNSSAVFTFANQAGLDMLETTLVALQDITLEKILDEAGRTILMSEFPKIMQQGYAYLPAGVCVSSMGRPISYEQAVAWKVVDDDEEDSNHCLAFMFINWSFV